MNVYKGYIVVYISASGKQYFARVTDIPENPGHKCCAEPTVSLEFRLQNNKLCKIERVLPEDASSTKRQIWKLVALQHSECGGLVGYKLDDKGPVCATCGVCEAFLDPSKVELYKDLSYALPLGPGARRMP